MVTTYCPSGETCDMKPTRILPPSFAAEGAPLDHVFVADGHPRLDGGERVHALVVLRAVHVHAHGLAVAREGVAIGAGVHALDHHAAAGLADIAQAPGDQGNRGRRERLDDALLGLGGHQRHVAIEDRRAHRVGRRLDADLAGGHLLALELASDFHRDGGGDRAPLDLAPEVDGRTPGARGGLFGRELGRLIGGGEAARVDLADLHTFARGFGAQAVDVDRPRGGLRGSRAT